MLVEMIEVAKSPLVQPPHWADSVGVDGSIWLF